jgi:uncharacterized protein (TIGR03437 family)
MVAFESSTNLGRVWLKLSPSLEAYMTIRAIGRTQPFAVAAGESIPVEIKLKDGLTKLQNSIGGTVHVALSPSLRMIANPLVISVMPLGETTSNLSGEGERTCSQLRWSADGFEAALLAAGEATLTVHSDCDLTGVVFWLTPSLQNYMSVIEPSGPVSLSRGGSQNVKIRLNVSASAISSTVVAGTLHARSSAGSRRTYPLPCPINLRPQQGAPAEQREVVPGIAVNGANFKAGPVAPGEVVTIFGDGLGPEQLRTLEIDSDGRVANYLADTMVLFDGLPSPLMHTRSDQVGAIVPFGVSGKTSVEMLVAYKGKTSALILLPVAEASPSLFTLDASGTGQAAVLNENLTLNGYTNPARIGTVIVLFGTGTGLYKGKANNDGEIVGASLPVPQLPIFARVGGVTTDIIYVGGAPDIVNGVFQMNVRIPLGAPTGTKVPIQLTVGDVSTTASTTVAIQ